MESAHNEDPYQPAYKLILKMKQFEGVVAQISLSNGDNWKLPADWKLFFRWIFVQQMGNYWIAACSLLSYWIW